MGRPKRISRSRGRYDLYNAENAADCRPCRTLSPQEIAKLKLGSEREAVPACGRTIELNVRGKVAIVSDHDLVKLLKEANHPIYREERMVISEFRAKISRGGILNGKEQLTLISNIERLDMGYFD